MARIAGVGKLVVGDIIGGILYAPLFWYGRGATDAGRVCWRMIKRRWESLGIGIWVRNIFVPMFGQQDFTGKLISFFMRLLQIIGRVIVMAVWFVVVAVLFVIYLIAPFVIVYEFFRQLVGLLIK